MKYQTTGVIVCCFSLCSTLLFDTPHTAPQRFLTMSSYVEFVGIGLVILLGLIVLGAIASIVVCRINFQIHRIGLRPKDSAKVVAFFHPHCSAGGGGERVLWKALQVLGDIHEEGTVKLHVVIYTIDPPKDSYQKDVLDHVKTRFSIELSPSLPLTFIHLDHCAHYLARSSRFSMVAESLGTMRLAYRALSIWPPDVFMDTTGCAFTFFVARVLAGCRVGAYVHYPTISTDMLSLVWERRPSYNHDTEIAKNPIITYVKLAYYALFALGYGAVGSLANTVMVNSSWTYGHIHYLWRGASRRISVVFPPCDVKSLENLCLQNREPVLVSIGQFRPEKNHALQIQSLAHLIKQHPDMAGVKLVLVGSCRGASDEARVQELRDLAALLDLTKSVDFVLNQPYSVVKEWFGRASVGLHTMWNEHFGIGVVEMMAAGLVTVAHNSGGPKADIVVPLSGQTTGYLASTVEEYADAIYEALTMDPQKVKLIRTSARQSSERFSDEVFSTSFKKVVMKSNLLS